MGLLLRLLRRPSSRGVAAPTSSAGFSGLRRQASPHTCDASPAEPSRSAASRSSSLLPSLLRLSSLHRKALPVLLPQKKGRVTDALNATKAAVEKEIVPGGGVALLCASREVEKLQTIHQKIWHPLAPLRIALGHVTVGQYRVRRYCTKSTSEPQEKKYKIRHIMTEFAAIFGRQAEVWLGIYRGDLNKAIGVIVMIIFTSGFGIIKILEIFATSKRDKNIMRIATATERMADIFQKSAEDGVGNIYVSCVLHERRLDDLASEGPKDVQD